MQLIFATHNKNKLMEVKSLIPPTINLLSLSDINCLNEIPETGSTIKQNALIKAEFVYQTYNLNCLADDSGLEIEALNGAPGVYSARYAGDSKNDIANIKKVLHQVNGITNRKACFKTVLALIVNEKNYFFEGVVNGQITLEPIGENGFGYDPVFIPEGYNQTFAQMDFETKNKISHRALAVNKLIGFLETQV